MDYTVLIHSAVKTIVKIKAVACQLHKVCNLKS